MRCDSRKRRTTVAQKNTTTRMAAHSNYMLIDFHSLTPEARVANCQSGFRLREADCKVFIRTNGLRSRSFTISAKSLPSRIKSRCCAMSIFAKSSWQL